MHYWEDGMDGAWGFVMVFGMLAFWALAAVAVIWAIRSTRHSGTMEDRIHQLRASDAEQILAGRLARGEIGPDEYRTTLAVLRSGSLS